MDWVKTINNAIAYMENHLTDDIALADIAKSVDMIRQKVLRKHS